MSSRKIISNYILEEDNTNKEINLPKSTPVIKIPLVNEKEKKIEATDLLSKIKEPRLNLTRNNEGVVVGIEVQCVCGEKILIKLDY